MVWQPGRFPGCWTYQKLIFLFTIVHSGLAGLAGIVFPVPAFLSARVGLPRCTHLLQDGTDIAFIQKLLGHNDIKTTMIYAKIGEATLKNVKSPLDGL